MIVAILVDIFFNLPPSEIYIEKVLFQGRTHHTLFEVDILLQSFQFRFDVIFSCFFSKIDLDFNSLYVPVSVDVKKIYIYSGLGLHRNYLEYY